MKNKVLKSFTQAHACLTAVLEDELLHETIAQSAELLVASFQSGGKVISCGNGGSMCDAMHFAEELSGKFRTDRKALPALSISDPGFITCAGNDYGYEHIFARFIEAHLNTKDVLLAITTSGKSPNVIKAAQQAQAIGGKVIALTGKPQSEICNFADIIICTQGAENGWADRIQELHIKVIHILIELIEYKMFNLE